MKIPTREEVETHYDLGVAYYEMGLLDDAIGEFSIARRGCVGKKKELDCFTMIGVLHLQKSDANAAVIAFKQALGCEAAVGAATRALRYELASAWEAAGRQGKALFHFQAVRQADPNFRDAGARASRLVAAGVEPETDDFPSPGSGGLGGSGHPERGN